VISIPFLGPSRESPASDVPTPVTGDTEYSIDANDGLSKVIVINPTDGDLDIVVTPTVTIAGIAPADTVITIPAHSTGHVGPWPPAIYNDSAERCIIVDASSQLQFTGTKL